MWWLGTAGASVSNTFSLYSSTLGTSIFTILSNGFYGIGTSSPASNLDVVGTGIFRNTANQLNLYTTSSTIGDDTEIKFLSCNGNGWSIG